MPSKGSLVQTSRAKENNQRNHENILGAYWLNREIIANSEDIKFAIKNIQNRLLSDVQIKSLSPGDEFRYFDTMETDLMHIGHMISSSADSQIVDLDNKIKKIQSLASLYERNLIDSGNDIERINAWREITDLSLSVGTEVRSNLVDSLRNIRDFGEKLEIPLTAGSHSESMGLLQSASLYFPSQWNKAMSFPLELTRDNTTNHSEYSNDGVKKILIGNDGDRIHTASNLSDLHDKISRNDESFLTGTSFIHELSHLYEENSPNIIGVSNRFLARRGKVSEMKDELEGPGYIYDDHFASRYTGRYYTHGTEASGEMFSTGMEATFKGSNGSLLGLSLPLTEDEGQLLVHFNPDPEHRNLIIGFLATLSLPKEKAPLFGFNFKRK